MTDPTELSIELIDQIMDLCDRSLLDTPEQIQSINVVAAILLGRELGWSVPMLIKYQREALKRNFILCFETAIKYEAFQEEKRKYEQLQRRAGRSGPKFTDDSK